ncbi:MAG: RNA methyltransferase, partial [Pseudomonadota bacterium]|nr:RNA methyltransferase [Pseudomonadota bacterium]
TARSRRVALEELLPRDAAARAVTAAAAGAEVALVFGRERTGLTNDELQLCHFAVHIPANPDYSSLNLAAAVQVLSYELRLAILDTVAATDVPPAARRADPSASHAQLEGFFEQLGQTLDAIDFHKGRAPDSAMRKLRRLFLRADLDEREVRLLRGILADAERMAMLAGRR